MENVGVVSNGEDEILKTTYGKQQQLELVLAIQELSKFGNHELGHVDFDE
jgi:hypothetical protein